PLGLAAGFAKVFGAAPAEANAGDRNGTHASDEFAGDSRLIARYLLDTEPAQELVDRYREGCRTLLPAADASGDREWSWVRRHPWSLPFIDAAAAWDRKSSLRLRIYLMAALLEATPAHAEFFLRRSDPPARLVFGLVWHAVRSALKTVIGIPLRAYARTC